MILCTTDLGLKDRVEAALARVRPLAVQLAIEQAEALLQTTNEINGRLNADGKHLITAKEVSTGPIYGISSHPPDERDLLALAEKQIQSARDARDREDFPLAWKEARRAAVRSARSCAVTGRLLSTSLQRPRESHSPNHSKANCPSPS